MHTGLWSEIIHEHLFTQLPLHLHDYLPRTPAQFLIIGSCTFAVALAVQGQPLELHFAPCVIYGAISFSGCIVIRGPSAALIIDTVRRVHQPRSFEYPGLILAQIITWGTGFHFMFLHGWGGGPSMDMSRGHEMMAWCAALAPLLALPLFHHFGQVRRGLRDLQRDARDGRDCP